MFSIVYFAIPKNHPHRPQYLGQYNIVGGVYGGVQILFKAFNVAQGASVSSSQAVAGGGVIVVIPVSIFRRKKSRI